MKDKKRANAPVKKPFPSYTLAAAVVAIVAIIIFIIAQQGNAPAVPPAAAPPVAQPAPQLIIDAHGCTTSSGFVWCELKSKCLQPSKENCTTITWAEAIKYCDVYDSVLICGDYIRATNHAADSSFFFYKKGSTTPIVCPQATQPMSDECKNLIFKTACIVPILC